MKLKFSYFCQNSAEFVPHIDNWAVCDSYCSDAKWTGRLKGNGPETLWDFERISGIDFDRISSEYRDLKSPYYVRMGVAWLLATALAKFPDRTRKFVNSSPCPEDVLKLYVRKARESFRSRTVSPF